MATFSSKTKPQNKIDENNILSKPWKRNLSSKLYESTEISKRHCGNLLSFSFTRSLSPFTSIASSDSLSLDEIEEIEKPIDSQNICYLF